MEGRLKKLRFECDKLQQFLNHCESYRKRLPRDIWYMIFKHVEELGLDFKTMGRLSYFAMNAFDEFIMPMWQRCCEYEGGKISFEHNWKVTAEKLCYDNQTKLITIRDSSPYLVVWAGFSEGKCCFVEQYVDNACFVVLNNDGTRLVRDILPAKGYVANFDGQLLRITFDDKFEKLANYLVDPNVSNLAILKNGVYRGDALICEGHIRNASVHPIEWDTIAYLFNNGNLHAGDAFTNVGTYVKQCRWSESGTHLYYDNNNRIERLYYKNGALEHSCVSLSVPEAIYDFCVCGSVMVVACTQNYYVLHYGITKISKYHLTHERFLVAPDKKWVYVFASRQIFRIRIFQKLTSLDG